MNLYFFLSSRDGCSEVVELPVTSMQIGHSTRHFSGGKTVPLDRYHFVDEHGLLRSTDVERGLDHCEESGRSSGIGDNWHWSRWYALSRDAADQLRAAESARVSGRYAAG